MVGGFESVIALQWIVGWLLSALAVGLTEAGIRSQETSAVGRWSLPATFAFGLWRGVGVASRDIWRSGVAVPLPLHRQHRSRIRKIPKFPPTFQAQSHFAVSFGIRPL